MCDHALEHAFRVDKRDREIAILIMEEKNRLGRELTREEEARIKRDAYLEPL